MNAKRLWLIWAPVLRLKSVRWLGLGMVCALLLGSSLFGQLGRSGNLKGFKYAEFFEDQATGRRQTNHLKGMLKGAEGKFLSNEVVLVNQMQLEHYQPGGQTSLVAVAPICLFDWERRVAWSTGRLDLVGLEGALRVRGYQGFEVRMTNNTMILSNRVRAVLRRELLRQQTP